MTLPPPAARAVQLARGTLAFATALLLLPAVVTLFAGAAVFEVSHLPPLVPRLYWRPVHGRWIADKVW